MWGRCPRGTYSITTTAAVASTPSSAGPCGWWVGCPTPLIGGVGGVAGTIIVEISPPRMRKGAVFLVLKVRDRCVEIWDHRLEVPKCPYGSPYEFFVLPLGEARMSSSLWGSFEGRKWRVRVQAVDEVEGVVPRLRKRVMATLDKKVRPLESMVLAPSSDADATWWALLSRWRRRVEDSPVM